MLAHRDKQDLYDEVKLRHEDIIRLEASIQELHEMFNDMSLLVQSQVSGEGFCHFIEVNRETIRCKIREALVCNQCSVKAIT